MTQNKLKWLAWKLKICSGKKSTGSEGTPQQLLDIYLGLYFTPRSGQEHHRLHQKSIAIEISWTTHKECSPCLFRGYVKDESKSQEMCKRSSTVCKSKRPKKMHCTIVTLLCLRFQFSSSFGSDKNILSMKIWSTGCPGSTNEFHSGLAVLFPYMDVIVLTLKYWNPINLMCRLQASYTC